MEHALKEAFYRDVYSKPFNILRYLGQWSLETDNTCNKYLYLSYRWIIACLGAFVVISGLVDLYISLSDIKKVVFNICTTILITGVWLKNIHIQLNSKKLNELRMNLFKDGWAQRKNPEDVKIREKFTKIFLQHKKVFYYASFSLLPLWLSTSLITLVRGPRQLPFSAWTPVDLDDNFQFFCGFIYHTLASIYIVAEAIQADLAMFSLLLQISSQYGILAKNVHKISELYREKTDENKKIKRDINKMLLRHQTMERLKECIQRQLQLTRYVKELESVYSKAMMYQLICGFVLTIGNGLELLVVSMNLSLKLSYQLGYTAIVLSDVFMCCNLADLLLAQGQKVVWSYYDIVWFEMDSDIRKHLNLAIIGAQKAQPLTAAKMFNLNLTMFLGMLKNVYSWLALFRQLVIKK